jgi:hypothetical protein
MEDLRAARDVDARALVRRAKSVNDLAGIACHDRREESHELQRLEVHRGNYSIVLTVTSFDWIHCGPWMTLTEKL